MRNVPAIRPAFRTVTTDAATAEIREAVPSVSSYWSSAQSLRGNNASEKVTDGKNRSQTTSLSRCASPTRASRRTSWTPRRTR